jgi:hypothetical protein
LKKNAVLSLNDGDTWLCHICTDQTFTSSRDILSHMQSHHSREDYEVWGIKEVVLDYLKLLHREEGKLCKEMGGLNID